jgi:RHS repeat-associated protein
MLERQTGTNFVTAVTDQLGRRTALGYDGNGNPTSVTRLPGTASAQTTTYAYDGPFSQVSQVTDPLNHTTAFSYDPKGNLTKVTDPLDRETTFTYNLAGQPTSAKNGLNHTTRFTYELGDLVAVEDPLGRTTRQLVDGVGRVVSVTDPAGNHSRVRYDALNQPTEATDPAGNTNRFTYDPNGNLLTVTDARDHTTTYTYDQMDRVATLTDPLDKTQSYDYDANGNLESFTSRRGKTTTYTYDVLDRPTQVKYGVSGSSSESTTGYTWDTGNRLTQLDDSAGGTITYTPDNLDRLTNETSPQGSVGYGYDDADRLTSMQVAGQPQVTYGYNNADQPTTITQGSQTVTAGYDDAGRPTSLALPGGVSETYGYDDASQLTSITYKHGTTTLGDLTYAYNQAGLVAQLGGSFARTAIPQPFASASYNANNQLTSRGGTSYTYDDDGNLTGDGTTTYTWDARGQLTGLSRTGLTASFAYDAVGRRTGKTVNGTATGYLHDGANPTQELSGSTPTANLLTGGLDEYFTRTDSTGQRTYLTDALGSTIALVDPAGEVKTQYTYEPFGKSTVTGEANSNPLQFTGREDDITGLYYYRARYYHPGLQRFISEDPAGFAAGDTNLYAYVFNSPTNLTDPSGENPLVIGCVVGAAFGGGMSYASQRLAGRKVNWADVGREAAIGCIGGLVGEGLGWVLGRALGMAFGRYADDALRAACRANSFTGDTPVLMADGTTRRIADVKVGEMVMAADPQTGERGPRRVTEVIVGTGKKELVDVQIDGHTITATDGHPFWVADQRRWVDAKDLEPGNLLRTSAGTYVQVDTVRKRTQSKTVYNLSVDGLHTYHVVAGSNDVLVHNCAWRPPGGRGLPRGGPETQALNARIRDAFLAHNPEYKQVAGGYNQAGEWLGEEWIPRHTVPGAGFKVDLTFLHPSGDPSLTVRIQTVKMAGRRTELHPGERVAFDMIFELKGGIVIAIPK